MSVPMLAGIKRTARIKRMILMVERSVTGTTSNIFFIFGFSFKKIGSIKTKAMTNLNSVKAKGGIVCNPIFIRGTTALPKIAAKKTVNNASVVPFINLFYPSKKALALK